MIPIEYGVLRGGRIWHRFPVGGLDPICGYRSRRIREGQRVDRTVIRPDGAWLISKICPACDAAVERSQRAMDEARRVLAFARDLQAEIDAITGGAP